MTKVGTLEFPETWEDSFRVRIFRWLKIKLDSHGGGRWIFPGLMKLLAVFYRFLKPKGIVLTSVLDGEIKIYLDGKDDVMTPEILAYGFHEEAETRLFKKSLKPGMAVIDIGANIGYYSLIASKEVGPHGKVYAFEPAPYNYAVLCKNREVNACANIVSLRKALSNHEGYVDLFCDERNFGAHTLAVKNIETGNGTSVKIETLQLDDFVKKEGIARVDFIKIDVQGAEGLVFEKAEKVLMTPGLKILMEFWPAGLRNLNTDPHELLQLMLRNFNVSIVENNKELLNLGIDEILKISENRGYVDLFCVRKQVTP